MSHSDNHSHEHGHDHDHHGDDYFLDQLCLIALSGAFGAICLTMFFWKSSYLSRILAPQFYDFILGSGIALIVLFVIRALAVWKLAGVERPDHSHSHEHHHDHDHAHEHHHDHDHAHEHSHDHQHHHEHEHEHEHGHDHSHGHDDGHEHAFAPWRYVVLVVPIVLFFLDLPREKKPKLSATVDLTREAQVFGSISAMGFNPLSQLCLVAAFHSDFIDPSEVQVVDFKDLEQASYLKSSREFWKGKAVEVIGLFSRVQNSDHIFTLVRYRIQCCGADAIPLDVKMICKEPIANIQQGEWVKVIGRVDFLEKGNGRFDTILRIPKQELIQRINAPANPYIQ